MNLTLELAKPKGAVASQVDLSPPDGRGAVSVVAADGTETTHFHRDWVLGPSTRLAVLVLRPATSPRPVVDRATTPLEAWTLQAASPAAAAAAVATLREWLEVTKPRRFVVVANPFAGRQKARGVVADVVVPLLQLAHEGNEFDVVETTHRGHATDVARSLDISRLDGALLAGGDGLVHEFFNGLLTRPHDWSTARLAVPVAHIAAGSGNGLAASMNAVCARVAVLAAVKGWTREIDAMATFMTPPGADPETEPGEARFCNLSLTWGLVGDINGGSEAMRWIGPLRFDVVAAVRLACKRTYGARIAFLPADDDDEEERADSVLGTHDEEETPKTAADLAARVRDTPLSAIFAPGSGWTTLPAHDYFYFSAQTLPHQSDKFNAAPHARAGDGCMDVGLLDGGGASALRLVPTLLDQSKGKHIDGRNTGIQYQKVRAVVVVPVDPAYRPAAWARYAGDGAKWSARATCAEGHMVLDGEVTGWAAALRVQVVPRLLRVFAPRDLDEEAFARHVPKIDELLPLGATWAQ
ncbi:hypothetical protein H9P43_003677 [Blastocladiella emersonii ATCC 22665]|nr:hypothetical protein H9P43_003677 [Blastocladiella emersonii ATCC 22665]